MSERILKALMQLFAIIAKVEDNDVPEEEQSELSAGVNDGRQIVLDFLKFQLNQELVDEYIKVFDEYLEAHQGKSKKKEGKRKRTAMNSVKVLRICTQINEELAQKQKIIVLIRILEFINTGEVTEQELEFATTVAETFNISSEEFEDCRNFVEGKMREMPDKATLLSINNDTDEEFSKRYQNVKHIYSADIDTEIRVLRVSSVNLYFLRYFGQENILLNGQHIDNERNYVLTHGSSMRSQKVKPIYQSDIVNRFLSDTVTEKIVFRAKDLSYVFKGGNIGLHDFNMVEESGKLLGIMGGSGAGKSTLLNLLNGNYKPTTGTVTVNGIDIHSKNARDETEGLIGYVSQDDLLIEELTVYQNLYYNAKLCFGDMSNQQIHKLVIKLLEDLGLSETKDLKVGSPLQKTISGGQRKRVNIGLELIREPAVLFVDEPTSGLSSRDSQNIMDLLKELTLKGKLIFVVIHQPSSDIFKMFDKLLILDLGGHPVYFGNPVDGIQYFKELANYASVNEDTSGNVNPEEIFDIIDAKVVDEYGNLTTKRKVSPKEWYNKFLETHAVDHDSIKDPAESPKASFKIPNIFKQFFVFVTRDFLSKVSNTQYVLINLLEAPALAAILAFFVKYFDADAEKSYVFRESENLPAFLFISVVVALFIGLTVSAEEIIKDQKILKREQFLNLSKLSYLKSKIIIMFFISAIQTFLYVVVGNLILEIEGMTMIYWLILFSVSCFANVLGLNISASFNSAKVIYILIPILIIPQLLFSGVIVPFDKLHPAFASEKRVPLIGNVMASRWAYEAMAVAQFKNNDFNKEYYALEKDRVNITFTKDYWLEAISGASSYIAKNTPKYQNDYAELLLAYKEDASLMSADDVYDMVFTYPNIKKELDDKFLILTNEINKQDASGFPIACKCTENLNYESYSALGEEGQEDIQEWLNIYIKAVNTDQQAAFEAVNDELEALRVANQGINLEDDDPQKSILKSAYDKAKAEFTNEALSDFVTARNAMPKMKAKNGEIINKSDPIYFDPRHEDGFLGAHFYAPQKSVFGSYMATEKANMLVIWVMTVLLMITLYFDALKKLLDGFGKLSSLVDKIRIPLPKKKGKK